jgi:hypothetical protein
MLENEGFALPAIVVMCGSAALLDAWFSCIGWGATVRPFEWTLNYWLMLVLGAAYAVWAALRARGAVDAAAGQWFVLAAYGLWMRGYCFALLFGLVESFGDRSLAEELTSDRGRFLIAAHRYGGLLAFSLGLAMVALCSRPINGRSDRADTPPSGRRRPAGRARRAPREDAPPS